MNNPQHSHCQQRWKLEQALLRFDTVDWTLRSSFDGMAVLGGIGGGKSSSSVLAWDHAMFEAGAGGLAVVVKVGEAKVIMQRVADCGRLADLVLFCPRNNWCFNPIQWALDEKMSVATIVHMLETVMEVVIGPVKAADAFFKPQEQGLLESALIVLQYCGQVVTPALLAEFFAALPKSPEEASSGEYQLTIVGDCMRRARKITKGTIDGQTVEAAIDHFLRDYPAQPPNTRACVEMGISGLLRPFSVSPVLQKLFCGQTNVTPDDPMSKGKIIVCDVPINLDRQVGRLANAIWKTCFQMAVERRDESLGDELRPVFLRLEEGQEVFTTGDAAFQAKCRSGRCATCFITQNLPGMYFRTHGDRHIVDAFFGNLSTHVYHSNSDVSTCECMSKNLGQSYRFQVSGGDSQQNLIDRLLNGGGQKDGFSIDRDLIPNVYPDDFRRLKRGGPPDFEVSAYVLLMGDTFADGQHYSLVTFSQRSDSAQAVPRSSSGFGLVGMATRILHWRVESIFPYLTLDWSRGWKLSLTLWSRLRLWPNAKR